MDTTSNAESLSEAWRPAGAANRERRHGAGPCLVDAGDSSGEEDSAARTRRRFASEAAARKYAGSLGGTATHWREVSCIRAGLSGVSAGSRVLDLPSGTGRLLPLLVAMGFRVTEADSSPHMVELARAHAEAQGLGQGTEFRVADAFATGFPDGAFDAILSNRLFHHFSEAAVRRRCLSELSRICRGPIVVSFFCTASLDAVMFRFRHWLSRRTPSDRIPIPLDRFGADARACGLRVVRILPTRGGVSKQWYGVLERAEAKAGPFPA